jgi:enoyl-CoA hydratase/carnithine racemase
LPHDAEQPGAGNILNKPTSGEISAAWIDLREDRAICCAILTGAPACKNSRNTEERPR